MSASNNLQKNKKSKEIWQSRPGQNKMAMVGLVTLTVFVLIAIFGPILVPFSTQEFGAWVTSSGHPAAIIFWEPMIWAGTSWRPDGRCEDFPSDWRGRHDYLYGNRHFGRYFRWLFRRSGG